ncbi:anti-sigma factor [Kitasatospora sp. NBC_01287]|uniref:anti-sigma factor n=1 Tax=Kitasatospora sp. NBC_01287 TaxID=2903573 RepID=UPI0022522C0D|nr:anti-sigma factor [Kitasatospora sp. NBC_01287]MCX4746217.1 anti-sigma factor [Kitasatospora sp. NBC_01287]
MTGDAEAHTLAGAYAAHALAEDERAAFERHLAQCPACALDVREFTGTLARLGAAEAVTPPPELRARVLAATSTVRQLPPETTGPHHPDPHHPDPHHPDPHHPDPHHPAPPRTRRWSRFALAACLALAAALGGLALQQHQRADDVSARTSQLQAQQARLGGLLAAPDARTTSTKVGSGTGTVIWSRGQDQAGFLAQGLPAPGTGRVYELWFDDAGTMRPAGLLPTTTGTLLLNGGPHGAIGVGMTLEPTGGSPHPTTTPLFLLPLT